jgi:hypothetical protein
MPRILAGTLASVGQAHLEAVADGLERSSEEYLELSAAVAGS